jgi:predicted lactoylglutathione lyase
MRDGSGEAAAPTGLKLKLFSHATLHCKDIAATRKFFAEFLGFETVLMSMASFWARLGGETVIVVVQGPPDKAEMPFLNHNGLDVSTEAEVDEAHARVIASVEEWGLTRITKPKVVHGTYGFYFWDADENAWEILCNPQGGYGWAFELGDQVGLGHMSRNFARPESTLTKSR